MRLETSKSYYGVKFEMVMNLCQDLILKKPYIFAPVKYQVPTGSVHFVCDGAVSSSPDLCIPLIISDELHLVLCQVSIPFRELKLETVGERNEREMV